MGFRIHKRKGILLNTLSSLLGHSEGYILRTEQPREKLKIYKGDNLNGGILDFLYRKSRNVIYHINLKYKMYLNKQKDNFWVYLNTCHIAPMKLNFKGNYLTCLTLLQQIDKKLKGEISKTFAWNAEKGKYWYLWHLYSPEFESLYQ